MPLTSDAPRGKAPGARSRASSWWGAASFLVPLLTCFLLSWHSLGDLDIWFHQRAGRDFIAGQGVPSSNFYSFTEPDHPWINHEWLFQALAAVTGPKTSAPPASFVMPDVTGWNLLRTLLCCTLLVVLLAGDQGWKRLLGRCGSVAAAWSGVPVLAGLVLLWPRLTVRPELFSYIFTVAVIREADQFFRQSRYPGARDGDIPAPHPARRSDFIDPRQPAGRLIFLTVAWAQFHGFAALVPLLLLLAWLLAPLQSLVDRRAGNNIRRAASSRRGLVLVVLSALALTLTPNGWHGLLMPVRALAQFAQGQVDLRATVSELAPLIDSPNSLGLTIAAYRASLVWGLIWSALTFGRVSLLRILVFALAAAAAWSNQRSIGLYAVAFILLHTGAGSRPWRWRPPARLAAGLPPAAVAAAGLAVTLLAAGLWWPRIVGDDFYLHEGVSRRFGSGLTPAQFPVEAAVALASLREPPVFANLDAAAFLLAFTSARPYIDGRTEAYSAGLWSEYNDIKKGDDRALAILAGRPVAAVCLATASGAFDALVQRLLTSPGWDLRTAEGAGLLFRPAADPKAAREPRPTAEGRRLLERAAGSVLDSAGNQSPTRSADLCLAAGRLYKWAGNDGQQEEAFRRGLGFNRNHPTLNHNLGNLLMGRNEFREALPLFLAALAVNPRLGGSALNAGVCQMRLGNPAEAARSFRRAVDLYPGRFEGWVNLAAACQGSGDRTGAAAALRRALELRPGDSRLRQRLRELQGGARN